MKHTFTLLCSLALLASTISQKAYASSDLASSNINLAPVFDQFRDHFPDRPGREEIVRREVNQRYQGRSDLPLRQLLGLGPQYRGKEIRYVVLRAQTAAGRGQAAVEVNGRVLFPTQTVGTTLQDYYFQLPADLDEIGIEIQQLQLVLEGNFYVESVGVALKRERVQPGPGPRPGPGQDACSATYAGTWHFRGGRPMNIALSSAGFGRVTAIIHVKNGPLVVSGTCNYNRFSGEAQINFDNGVGSLTVNRNGQIQGNYSGIPYIGQAI